MLLPLLGGGEAMLDGVGCALKGFNDLPWPSEFILKLTNTALASIQTGGMASKEDVARQIDMRVKMAGID